MQKKKLGLVALASLAALSLASCGGNGTTGPQQQTGPKNGNLNIYLNYNGKNGVSYIKSTAYPNRIKYFCVNIIYVMNVFSYILIKISTRKHRIFYHS